MADKHTPGPWLRDGRLVYALHHDGTYHRGQPQLVNRLAARVDYCAGGVDEAEANARLIAAAPDLLAALRDAEAKLTAAAAMLSACGELAVGQALRSGTGVLPSIDYDGSGETDCIGLSTDCANSGDRAAAAIAKAEGSA